MTTPSDPLPPSERQVLEDALCLAQQRFALADAAGDGHTDWIVATDDFYGSPRFMELCGLPPDTKFKGRAGFIALFPYHPDDKARIVAEMSDHYAGGTARIETEMRLLVRGEVRWAHVTGVCTRDADGKMVRWTSSLTDITKLKKAEAALRESEERFALAVAASADGIWDWDIRDDAMFISDRAQHLFGLQVGPSTRKRADWLADVVYHPADAQRRMRHVEEHLAGMVPVYDGEWRVLHPDGAYRWVRIRGLCQRDGDGSPTRMAGSISDIDIQKCAEAALRQSQRLEAMGTLAGGIAHDFNNILGSVLGYGEMALRDAPTGSRLRRDLTSIVTAGERGRALVERILAFSRSGVGERVAVNVERVVDEALELVAAKLGPGQSIQRDLQAGRAAMFGDATQVHQVVMNLASNALHSMADGGSLNVHLSVQNLTSPRQMLTGRLEPGEYVLLKVSDQGTGISPDIIERIFDPFFTTKEVGVGTGLGLSLVHGIVTDVGGALDLSTAVGLGSSFSVYLPRSGDAPDDIFSDRPALPRGHGERLMIVDDEQPLLTLSCETLGELGYLTHGYTSSLAALAAFCSAPDAFDALITDERMPALAGSVLIAKIRALRPTLPVLLVSGFPAEAQAQPMADVVLQKPLAARDLATSLARLLSERAIG